MINEITQHLAVIDLDRIVDTCTFYTRIQTIYINIHYIVISSPIKSETLQSKTKINSVKKLPPKFCKISFIYYWIHGLCPFYKIIQWTNREFVILKNYDLESMHSGFVFIVAWREFRTALKKTVYDQYGKWRRTSSRGQAIGLLIKPSCFWKKQKQTTHP